MQVTELTADGLKRAFTVVVPAADIEAARGRRLAAIGRDARLPGFRPGKVPAAVLKQRYGQAVMGEVLEQQVEEATRQLVADRGLRPALQPKVEVVNFHEGADLELKLDLETMPEVPMPDFAAIRLERPKATPGEAEIARALGMLGARHRTLEDVAEARPAAKGDVLVCDFVGRTAGEDGGMAPFPGGAGNEMPIEVGGEGFIPGFTEQLEGLAPGETRTIKVAFPPEYHAGELAGRDAEFEIAAKALKRSVLPDDEALAKAMGLDDAQALRERVSAQLQQEYDGMSRMRVKRALLDQLAAQADFPVPEGMVENEFAQIWQRVQADREAGRPEADDQGKDEETLRIEYRGIAERRIRLGLLLSEIGRTNNVQVAGDELARAMRQEAGRYPGQEQQVMEFFRKNPQAVDGLRAPLFEEKVVDFMLELAAVTETETTPAALAAADGAAPADGQAAAAAEGEVTAAAADAGTGEAAAAAAGAPARDAAPGA